VPARRTITLQAMRSSVRPGYAARRVMRRLRLGPAWSLVAMWFERRRPAVQIDDWSAPLLTAQPGLGQAPNVLAAALDDAGTIPAAPRGALLDPTVQIADGLPLRCLLATPSLDVGGVEEVIAFLARRLPSVGLQTAVLCASSDGAIGTQSTGRISRMLQSSGVEVCEVGASRAPDWIQRWRPDVISAHGAPAWVFDIASRMGVPYVDNLHCMNGVIGRDWRWHSEASRSRKLAAVVAVSDLLRRQQLAVNPEFPADRIVTIPNAVDDQRRMRGNRTAARDWLGITDEYLFVSLARHCMQKNSYGLITAFAELASRRPEAHLVIAGRIDEPRYYRRVLQLRDAMPCRDRIHLRDHVAAPAELLAAADGFVLDSFFEGWPLASMEALYAGVPVVITDVSGAREQIADDPSRGYVVANPLGDPLGVDWASSAAAQYREHANRAELVAAMERLISERDDRLRDRERLTAESAMRFSSVEWVERHSAVLRAAATGTAPTSTRPAQGAAVCQTR
jgi:glycosyltransferase involved in cell wall biosynthesis